MNHDDWLDRQATLEVRGPSEDEFEIAVDEVIDDEDLTELVKKDPVLRKRFVYLRRAAIDAAADEKRDQALDAGPEEDYCDDEDGDS